MTRRLLAPVLVTALLVGAAVRTAEPTPPPKDDKAFKDNASLTQERLQRQFKEFTQTLLRLAQRMESSGKPEDGQKALILKRAIEKASTANTEMKFEKLITILRESKELNLDELAKASDWNKDLLKDINEILAILMTDNRDAELKAERERLQALIKMLQEIIRQQQTVRAMTERNTMESKKLGKEQNQVTEATKALARAMGKDGKDGEGKTGKGEAKPGDGKNMGEGKEDTKDPKGNILERKKKEDENKAAEAKQPADDKEGKAGGKGGDPKEAQANGKGGDPKQGEKGQQSDSKGRGDQKAEAKPGQQNQGQQSAQAKSGQQGQQGQGKGDNQQPPPQDQNQQNAKQTPGRKQIEDANQDQQQAEKNIADKKNDDASGNQDDAIKKLKEAQKKLEDLLAQLREEELLRKLAALQARCERMRQMQIEVRNGTVTLFKIIEAAADHKPSRTEIQNSLGLSDKEEAIVREASQAMKLLEAEGSAVAFYEVFTQVRSDMQNVAARLRKTEVGVVTQTIEQDIIDTLTEMIEALKKKQQEIKDKSNKPPGPSNPNENSQLLDLLAELKMIRAMQVRVNNRTKTYANEYPELEQTPDPNAFPSKEAREKAEMVFQEMKNLADRQQKIYEVVNNIAKGKNEGGRP